MHSEASDREALEPQRRRRVGGADREAGEHRDRLDRALGDARARRRAPAHAATIARAVLVGHVARRERQERLVDAVDLDVLELVDADDVDVDREAGDQRPRRGPRARPPSAEPGQRVDRDQVERDDADRRADDVCGREKRHSAPSRPGCRPGTATARPVTRARRPQRAARARPTGTNTRARQRAEHEAPGEHEPPPQAHRRRARPRPRRRARAATRPAAGLRPADGDRVARCGGRGTSPARPRRARRPRSPRARTTRGTAPRSGTASTARRARAGCGRPAAPGPTTSATPPGLQHAVGLGDRRARARASTRSSRPRRSGRSGRSANGSASASPSSFAHARERRLALGAGELVRALVEHRHAVGVDALDDPLGREARTRAGVEDLAAARSSSCAASSAADRMAGVQNSGLTQRS